MNRVRRWLRVREKPAPFLWCAPFYGGRFILSVALSIFNSNELKGANMEVLFEVRKLVSLLTGARVLANPNHLAHLAKVATSG